MPRALRFAIQQRNAEHVLRVPWPWQVPWGYQAGIPVPLPTHRRCVAAAAVAHPPVDAAETTPET
jgi:hypothetical protein